MAISLNEIAQHSGEALNQINWTLSIGRYRSGWVLDFGRVH